MRVERNPGRAPGARRGGEADGHGTIVPDWCASTDHALSECSDDPIVPDTELL
jgi:hypothetical protein